MGGSQVEKPNIRSSKKDKMPVIKPKRRAWLFGFAGQDLVEFALVLPILILVVFGVLDLGRVFHAAIQMANSARVSARYATLHPRATDLEIKDIGVQEAIGSGIVLARNNHLINHKSTSPNKCGSDKLCSVKP